MHRRLVASWVVTMKEGVTETDMQATITGATITAPSGTTTAVTETMVVGTGNVITGMIGRLGGETSHTLEAAAEPGIDSEKIV